MEQLSWRALSRVGGTLDVDPVEPTGQLLGEVGIVVKAATGQEVLLDELDQVLDRTLLVASARVTGVGVKAKLGGALTESRVPDGLVGVVTPKYNRLHVIRGHDPGHAAEGDKHGDEAAQQGLFAHLGGKAHPHPAAVLEAGGEEVAGLTGKVRPGKGKTAHLAPVDLEQFAGQALKANRHLAGKALAELLERADIVVEGGGATCIGMLGVLAGLLEHALDGPVLVKPGLDQRRKDGNRTGALARGGLLVNRLTQDTGDGVPVVAGKRRNLDLTPALLVEIVNSRTIHKVQHPVCHPSAQLHLSARDGNGQMPWCQKATMGCRILNCKSADSYAVVYKGSKELLDLYI